MARKIHYPIDEITSRHLTIVFDETVPLCRPMSPMTGRTRYALSPSEITCAECKTRQEMGVGQLHAYLRFNYPVGTMVDLPKGAMH